MKKLNELKHQMRRKLWKMKIERINKKLYDFFEKAGQFMADYIHLILGLYVADVAFFMITTWVYNV